MPREIEGLRFYMILEVAQALDVTPQTVRSYIKQGRIRAQRIGTNVLITEKSLQEFLRAPDKVKPGRPKKART